MSIYIRAVVAAKAIADKYGIPLGDLVDTFADIPAADVAPVVRSKTQTSKIRRPDMERCELYEFGDWAARWAHLVTGRRRR